MNSFSWRLLFLLSGLSINAFCQPIGNTLTSLDSARRFAEKLYNEKVGTSSALINGVEYKEIVYGNKDIGHPYFLSDDWVTGKITYAGQVFNVDLMYNIVTDKLIIDQPFGHYMMELINDRLQSFEFDRHVFRRIISDSLNKLQTGFYEILYDGKSKVLAKRRKDIQESISGTTITKEFNGKDLYFIARNGQYSVARTKRAMLNLFYERKQMVRKNLTKQHIKFRKDKDKAFTESARFFDSSAL